MLQPSVGSVIQEKQAFQSMEELRAATDVWLRVADMAMVIVAMALAHKIRFGVVLPDAAQRMAMGTVLLYSLICFGLSPVYRHWRSRGPLREVTTLLLTWLVVCSLFSMHMLLINAGAAISRQWLISTFVIGGIGMVLAHGAVRVRLALQAQAGVGRQRVLAVGLRAPVLKLHRHLLANPGAGLGIVGYFATEHDRRPRTDPDLPACLGRVDELEAYLQLNHHRFEQVWVSMPMSDRANLKSMLKVLERYPLVIKLVPDIHDFGTLNPSVEQIGQVPMIRLRQGLSQHEFLLRKRIQDLVIASIAVLLLSPLYLVLAIGVKLSSPGPIFFKQKRHGLGGKEFYMLKFRSMHVHREDPNKITQATRNDPRVTKFGGFLRRTSLDELPQFFNVLGGSMSVVGPRPHAIQHNTYYERLIVRYMQRHYVKPGITGWAQVHGLRGETIELRDMRRRVRYDIDYIRRWSLGLDLRIIVLTAVKVLGQKTAY